MPISVECAVENYKDKNNQTSHVRISFVGVNCLRLGQAEENKEKRQFIGLSPHSLQRESNKRVFSDIILVFLGDGAVDQI